MVGRLRLAAALAVFGLGVAACKPQETAWERYDLRALVPVETSRPGILREATVFLGPEDVRDLEAAAAQPGVRRVSAGRLRALAQQQGSAASWAPPSGKSSFVTATPLASPGCLLAGRVLTSDRGGDTTTIWEGRLEPAAPFAPSAFELPLPAGARLVRFEVGSGASGCEGLWGEAAIAVARSVPRPEVAPARPNIILIGLDTLRADALGAWGREPSITPALDRFATESAVYTQAFASSNATNPSFASLLTGLWVKNHGVDDLTKPLPDALENLPERLRSAGWHTMAVLAAGHVPPALSAGFDDLMGPEGTFAGQTVVDLAIEMLQAPRAQPFFLWLHLFDPHTPHTPPQDWAQGRGAAAAYGFGPLTSWRQLRPNASAWTDTVLGASRPLYDAEVGYTDRQVDRFLGWLEARGLLNNTMVVVVADHGENLGDHGVDFRHAGLWDTTVHVPLMVRDPGAAPPGSRSDALVQHFDVVATILAKAGLPHQGLDAVPLAELVASGGRRAVFAEHVDGAGAMVRTRHHKLIELAPTVKLVAPGVSFYDLGADPDETTNVVGQGLGAEAAMRAALAAWLAERRGLDLAPRQLTPEEESELRALGYL